MPQPSDEERSFRKAAFDAFLRTGRWFDALKLPAGVEVKFNPWHDPENGRFTFVGQGRFHGTGPGNPAYRPGRAIAGANDAPQADRNDPRHPANHSIHIVEPGETLTGVAARRRGLRVSDLAWLNGLPPDRKLRVDERLKLPHRTYLEEGREAIASFRALAYYMDTHGGRLPPVGAKLPSIEEQALGPPFRREVKNGYAYALDVIMRTRRIDADLKLAEAPKRSATAQKRAGGADRLRTDDGGHYVAARFNGPRDGFNHFAQDANFNRGAYRALEDDWAKNLREGREVRVLITPGYAGASQRPDSIMVMWTINGQTKRKLFPNISRRQSSGGR